jgi:SAM-dependent methyltransferase
MWKKIAQRIAFGSRAFDIAYWRERADDPGTMSVMWENRAFNDLVDRDEWSVIEATLPEQRGAALDLGCGTGRVAARLAARFDSYTGVDLDTMVAEAGRRLPTLASSFVASTVADYDYPPERFDFILSLGCLSTACTTATLPDVARKIARALKPRGRVTLIEPFHTGRLLTRGCKMKPEEVSALFTSLDLRELHRGGILCFPARMVLSEPVFERFPHMTRAVYKSSERLARRFPSALADYAVLSLEKR